jgi:NADPH:quinone reductase-like Zn-dependent oxidoreductase
MRTTVRLSPPCRSIFLESGFLQPRGVIALRRLHDLDAIADTIGGTVAQRALKTLKAGEVFGTVLAPPKNANKLNVQVRTMMAEPDASRLYQLGDDVSRGSLLIPVAKVMPLDQVREAQQEAEEGHPQGKIILKPAA